MATTSAKGRKSAGKTRAGRTSVLPGQVVLVLQGGGALGAYQVGVYEALHEAGIRRPDPDRHPAAVPLRVGGVSP